MRFLSSLQNWKKYNLNILWIEATRNFNPKKEKSFFFFFNPDETWSKSLSYFSSVFSLSPTGRRLRSFLVRFSSLFAHQVAHSSSYSGPFAGNVRPNKMEDGKQRVPTAFAGFNFFFNFRHCRKYYGMALAAFSFLSCYEAKVCWNDKPLIDGRSVLLDSGQIVGFSRENNFRWFVSPPLTFRPFYRL